MEKKKDRNWWEEIPTTGASGDIIISEVGAGSMGIATGKNINQTVYGILGNPEPNDQEIIKQEIAKLGNSLGKVSKNLETNTKQMAEFQVKLLEGELVKTAEDEQPSANAITIAGDWLLDNVPDIAEALTALFATPAIGRIVGKAGEIAVSWVKKRFGKEK